MRKMDWRIVTAVVCMTAAACGDDGAGGTQGASTGTEPSTGADTTTGAPGTTNSPTTTTPTTGGSATGTATDSTTDDPTTDDPTTDDTTTGTTTDAATDTTADTTTTDATMGVSSTTEATGPECEDLMIACGDLCVDIQSDPQHCGGCDQQCGACEACEEGSCAPVAAPAAPAAIQGETEGCAGASLEFAVQPVPGATSYTWTGPAGSTVTQGQGTEAVTLELGAESGQVCVVASSDCSSSAPVCVDVTAKGGSGSQTFAFTGAAQQFVVPECVSTITVELWGAQGGGARCCSNEIQDDGGKGGYVKADLAVTPGEVLYAYVGGKGGSEGAGGWNGGGLGGEYGAGGGGASDVRLGGQQPVNRVLVAGGGGGGNCGCPDHGAGGDGGGLIGDMGTNGGQSWTPGGGGTQDAGGAAGSNPGAAGALLSGGGTNGGTYHIGGGGGGWYGGGGAYAAGGGGGSSYYGDAANASTQKGLRVGDGEIKISW